MLDPILFLKLNENCTFILSPSSVWQSKHGLGNFASLPWQAGPINLAKLHFHAKNNLFKLDHLPRTTLLCKTG